MSFQSQLKDLKKGEEFSRSQAAEFLGKILDDESVTDGEIKEMLTVLSKKVIKAEELSGFIDAMRTRMIRIKSVNGAIDTCGTGGDKSGTFNISTASAILVSSAGVPIAKHGNRAATSKCGSADVLEDLGIPIDLSPIDAEIFMQKNDFVFLFAPLFHPALKRLAIIRKELGFPTVFNLLGPLLNPAGVKRQVIGTFSPKNAELIAQVMAKMDYEHAIVLSSQDGLDEASLNSPVDLFEVRGELLTASTVKGLDFGLKPVDNAVLVGGDAKRNAQMIIDSMKPSEALSPQQAVVIFNSAIALHVSGKVKNIQEGIDLATTLITSGKAKSKLDSLRGKSNR